MSRLKRARERAWAFFHKPVLDSDLEAEIAAHLDMAIEENLRRGLPYGEARRMAMIRFGGMDLMKDQQRRRVDS